MAARGTRNRHERGGALSEDDAITSPASASSIEVTRWGRRRSLTMALAGQTGSASTSSMPVGLWQRQPERLGPRVGALALVV